MNVSPQACLATLKLALVRRPLWKAKSAADLLGIEYEDIMQQIKSGKLLWAFNIGLSDRQAQVRVLSLCVVEQKLGPVESIGSSRNLQLDEVVDLILPQHDIRSTPLAGRLSCAKCHLRSLKENGQIRLARKQIKTDGPHSYFVFKRASVARFLEERRIS